MISVVVVTRNRLGMLRACLDSIAAQTYPRARMELIVVDDGSTDGTGGYLRARAAGEPWIRAVSQAHGWQALARNRGVSEARGDLIAMTDDDCTAAPDWLASLATSMEVNCLDAVGGRVRVPGASLVHRYLAHIRVLDPELLPDGRPRYLATANACYRRSALERAGLFDDRMAAAGSEDVELSFRMRQLGMQLGYAPDCVVSHWYRPEVDDVLRRSYRAGAGTRSMFEKHPHWEHWMARADEALAYLLGPHSNVRGFREVADAPVRPWFGALELVRGVTFLAGYLRIAGAAGLAVPAARPGTAERTHDLLEALSGTGDVPAGWLAGWHQAAMAAADATTPVRALAGELDLNVLLNRSGARALCVTPPPGMPDTGVSADVLAGWSGHLRRLRAAHAVRHLALQTTLGPEPGMDEIEARCREHGVDMNQFLTWYGLRLALSR